MSTLEIGTYVTHAKLPELGTGEILAMDKGAIKIRFASGERNFSGELVTAHLVTTLEAPARPAKKTGSRARKAIPKAKLPQ
jgi:hypothetical protein